MVYDLRVDSNLSPGRELPPAAGEPTGGRGPGHGSDASVLGQAIVNRLFSAGLDLNFALSMDGDGPVAGRLRHAVAELDDAVKDLRHLVLAVTGPAAGAPPDELSRDTGPQAG